VLRAVAALGAGLVATRGATPGAGVGRDDLGAALCGAGHQRALRRLRHPGGLGGGAGDHEREVAAPLGGAAGPPGGGGAGRLVVLVLADRGLYARWLYQAIKRQEWHPFLRINHQGQYRPPGSARFQPLAGVVRQGEPGWSGAVECFASSSCRLQCTLLAQWTEAHRDPWLILTDLPAEVAQVAWYAMRTWIECGFCDVKRGGWDWQQTKMSDPERASRLWLVIAVATFAVVRAGGMAPSGREALAWDGLPEWAPVRPRGSRPRLLSCFRLGLVRILSAVVRGRRLPRGRLRPAPWPTALPLPPATTAPCAA
jgi:hypothetical protein